MPFLPIQYKSALPLDKIRELIGSAAQPNELPPLTDGTVDDAGHRRVSLRTTSEEKKFLQGRCTVRVRFDLTEADDGWDIALFVEQPDDSSPFVEKFVMRFAETFRLAPGQFLLMLDPATFGRST